MILQRLGYYIPYKNNVSDVIKVEGVQEIEKKTHEEAIHNNEVYFNCMFVCLIFQLSRQELNATA